MALNSIVRVKRINDQLGPDKRAVSPLQQLQDSTKRFVAQLREHAERREATWHAALALAQERATQRGGGASC